ncbi:MAG: hypothetical protein KME57_17410 [Scytonema hyalinum WJT4-NPBG1]|jgi:hypothetical protein|nr:hypothetical protein [Scytonema hyalinum WJT4-NPBG1]
MLLPIEIFHQYCRRFWATQLALTIEPRLLGWMYAVTDVTLARLCQLWEVATTTTNISVFTQLAAKKSK